MLYTKLGNTGLIVSRMAYGAMTFTMGNKTRPNMYKTDEEIARGILGQALDAGINFFDTADVYTFGESEELLGKILAPHRQDVIISTKAGIRMGQGLTRRGLSRHHLMNSIEGSLKRLGTDYVDVYIVHLADPLTPLEETLSALDDIVRSGKARYIGFSNWPAWMVSAAMELQRANGWAPFTHGQMSYSLLDRDIEHDVLPMMRYYGIGLTAWSPLGGGFLSGKYTRENIGDPDNRIDGSYLRFSLDDAFDLVDKIRPLAASRGVSLAQIALAWLLARDELTSIILGAAKPHQLEDNLGALDVVLNDDERALLDAATAPKPIYPHSFLNTLLVDQPVKAALARKPGDPA